MKTLNYRTPWGNIEKVAFVVDQYAMKKRLFVGMYCWDDVWKCWEPYVDITVNLPDDFLISKTGAFIDTNNLSNICTFLIENGLAKPANNSAFSGFCCYPEYEFNMEKLNEYILKEESAG